MYEITSVTMRH